MGPGRFSDLLTAAVSDCDAPIGMKGLAAVQLAHSRLTARVQDTAECLSLLMLVGQLMTALLRGARFTCGNIASRMEIL